MWDVSIITKYISSMGDNHSLPFESLSLKLLALSRPSRSYNLCNLDLRYMKSLPDGMEFKPSSLSKQSRPSKPATSFVFLAFLADKNLCPKEALLEYVSKTEAYRGSGKPCSSYLISNHTTQFHLHLLPDGF